MWLFFIFLLIIGVVMFIIAFNSNASSRRSDMYNNRTHASHQEYNKRRYEEYINRNINYSNSPTQKLTFKQLKKYLYVMDSKLSAEYFAANLHGQNSFNVSNELIAQWEEKLAKEKQQEKTLSKTADNNNKGIALEKVGDIDGAINVYEKNLEIGYPALHSYERLMILYRKQKKYKEEIRVIKNALEIFNDHSLYAKYIEKWNERLDKANELNLKP